MLTDVAAYKEWWPSTLGLRSVDQTEELLGSEWEVSTLLWPATRLRLEELEPPSNIRIRFFGGGLEGPGGFHLTPEDDATRVAYAVDVFARRLDMAALSQVLPLDRLYGLRMKRVLGGLRRRLNHLRRQSGRSAPWASAPPFSPGMVSDALAAPGPEPAAAPEGAARTARYEAEKGRVSPGIEPVSGPIGDEVEAAPVAGGAGPTEGPSLPIRNMVVRLAAWLKGSPGVARERESLTDASGEPVSNFEIAREYLRALSSDGAAEEIARFFAPNATGDEFSNLVLPLAATRNLGAILAQWTNARESWSGQSFDLRGATGGGSQVAMEIRWSAIAKKSIGPYRGGASVGARMALFLKFENRLIVRHRAYVCFETGPELPQPDPVGPADVPLRPSPPPMKPRANFDIARAYLAALSEGASGDVVTSFFAADAIQEELPSRLRPRGIFRDLEAIRRSRDEDLAGSSSSTYELLAACGGGSKVAMEVLRKDGPASRPGPAVQGSPLEARLAVFLKFRDGQIVRQRTYECA